MSKRNLDINSLQQKYKFERNLSNNKIKIIPLTKYSFQCRPLNKPNILEVTDEQFIGLISRQLQFNNELNEIINFVK